MKKFVGLILALFFVLCSLNAQNEKETSFQDTTKIFLKVDVETTKLKLPVQDVGLIYRGIDELKETSNTEFNAIMTKFELLTKDINSIVYRESDTKLEYIASNFDMNKSDISHAVQLTNRNRAVALVFPAILLFLLWARIYRFRHLEGVNAFIYIVLGLLLATATGFVIYVLLQGVFNADAALLKQLQELL